MESSEIGESGKSGVVKSKKTGENPYLQLLLSIFSLSIRSSILLALSLTPAKNRRKNMMSYPN